MSHRFEPAGYQHLWFVFFVCSLFCGDEKNELVPKTFFCVQCWKCTIGKSTQWFCWFCKVGILWPPVHRWVLFNPNVDIFWIPAKLKKIMEKISFLPCVELYAESKIAWLEGFFLALLFWIKRETPVTHKRGGRQSHLYLKTAIFSWMQHVMFSMLAMYHHHF